MKLKKIYSIVLVASISLLMLLAFKKKKEKINYPSYKGLVMCGYQGWFRTPNDGGSRGWVHYGYKGFDPNNVSVDLWPDMSEYKKTYKTPFKNQDGSLANVFSSLDASTIDTHFRWMKEYGIDGVFMQRFYNNSKSGPRREEATSILKKAFKSAKKYNRAIAVMYDLSGLKKEESCYETLVSDWKQLVDEIHFNKGINKENYLHHNGKPLVAIWGVGFQERPYTAKSSEVERFMDFVKNDPKYGNFSIMLGVPTRFRTLTKDSEPDPYLHEIIKQADIVQPWLVGRYKMPDLENDNVYRKQIADDLAWCKENNLDYVPTIYPGFSWYNLKRMKGQGNEQNANLNAIPRLKGAFFSKQIDVTIEEGVDMLYVAMFDEIDEGTAIFKVTNTPPVNGTFSDYEGLPSDHYLKLTGQAGKRLREKKTMK
ncbi:glycoside hydrolase family 71/99-like protein [Flammeovirga sp. OC4]|uniref:glycoside hydrolase family 71/99-like protein n=1 Tax=Flammeovirga sp. OC4 TaxID=1382345 RepID=UPI0005C6BF44|nr:glycoside hydrolase family 71/99-like protein [Flammeovirga sp. OC4]